MAKQQVTVPDIGGAEGAEVIELLVAVGDRVEIDQSLIVLESDKASMEVPAPFAGEVIKVLVEEGAAVSQGDDLLLLRPAPGAAPAPASPPAEAASKPAASEPSAPAPPNQRLSVSWSQSTNVLCQEAFCGAQPVVCGGVRIEVVDAEQERVHRRPLHAERDRFQYSTHDFIVEVLARATNPAG